MRLIQEKNKLIIANGPAQVWIEPWGHNSLRVRMTKEAKMDANDWALSEVPQACDAKIELHEVDLTMPWWKGEEHDKHLQNFSLFLL